jgi:nucleotide-binding universal stress UspA family protein
MKVLLAVDGSEYTQRMLDYIDAHAELFGDRHAYTVVYAVPAVPARAASVLGHDEMQAYYSEEAEKVFAPVRAFFDKRGLEAEYQRSIGHAANAIAKLADSGGYDLLVMGSHGHGALGKIVMGSTTTQVLARCRTPLLMIR